MKEYLNGFGIFEGLGLKNIHHNYNWIVGSLPPGLNIANKQNISNFDFTVELKFELRRIWKNFPNRRIELTKYIIQTWGGIRGNKHDTLVKYSKLNSYNTEFPLDGVASYSKVLGIIDPEKFAIYDARVAVALNAIQLLNNSKSGNFFPYLSGRNNITGNSIKKRGFSQEEIFKWGSSLFDGWERVQRMKHCKISEYLKMFCN